MARMISSASLESKLNLAQQEHPIVMPMNENRAIINPVYDAAAKVIAEHLDSRTAPIGFMSNKTKFEQIDILVTKNLPDSL